MKEMLPELEAVFDLADADGSGEIAIEETFGPLNPKPKTLETLNP